MRRKARGRERSMMMMMKRRAGRGRRKKKGRIRNIPEINLIKVRDYSFILTLMTCLDT